jgi:hypothetical protein
VVPWCPIALALSDDDAAEVIEELKRSGFIQRELEATRQTDAIAAPAA